MFDFLKKRINSFTDRIKERVEAKEEIAEEVKEEIPKKEEVSEEITPEKISPKEEIRREEVSEKEKIAEEEVPEKEILPKEEIAEEKVKEVRLEEGIGERIEKELKERKPEARLSIKTRIKKALRKEVSLGEKDVKGFFEEFELALLESDVEQDTATEIIKEIKKELIGKKINARGDITTELKKEIAVVLERVMSVEKIDLFGLIEGKKPFVILFLGPNGHGKTTTIAKLTQLFQKKGKRVVLSASDTFRAASIEQIEKHAEKLGVRVIKHKYGADPTAVAFDAVNSAKASGAEIVLIDSAGRQETNVNLMNELKKINRVINPDLKIFVGEAMSGNALLEQATQFNEWIGIDAFILTKIDCDAKGGTGISLLYKLKKPILFVGTGQGYGDLVEFTPRFIIDRVVD
ncbi:MAG: signal recognition particle-docking protein FtsY [archaeon]